MAETMTTSSFSIDWSKKLILIRGLPGSGKSTLAHEISSKTEPTGNPEGYKIERVVENDQFFTDFFYGRDYRWEQRLSTLAAQWCLGEAFRRLRNIDTVIVANTFVKREFIFPYLEWARKLKIQVSLISLPCELSPAELTMRNVHGVPIESIERMASEWEPMTQKEVELFIGLPESMRS